MPWLRHPVVVLCLLAALPAVGQVRLDDDCEDGGLLTSDDPPGPFDALSLDKGKLNSVGNAAAAAHRGSRGILVTDLDPTVGASEQARLSKELSPTVTGSLYYRLWLRVQPSNASGGDALLALRDTGSHVLYDFSVNFTSSQASVHGYSPSVFLTDATFPLADPKGWHLVEVAVHGLGSTQGARTTWLDGVQVATASGIDLSVVVGGRLQLGEPASTSAAFIGTIFYDDVRISTSPLASRFTWTVGSVSGGATCASATPCVPLTLKMVDVEGGAVAFPYPQSVDLSIAQVLKGSGGATFFKDASCSAGNATTSLALTQGSTSASVWVKPAACGTRELHAASLDFVAADALLANPGPVSSLAILSPAQTHAPGECSAAVTYVTADDSGTPSAASAEVSVTASGDALRFFTDPACKVPLSGAQSLEAGATGTLYFIYGGSSTTTLTLSASGLTSATQTESGQVPVATVQSGQASIAPGGTVTFDGTGSHGAALADGGISTLVAYRWSEPRGPGYAELGDGGTQGPTLSGKFPAPGDYVVQLVVEDDQGISSAPFATQVHVTGETLPTSLKIRCGVTDGDGALSLGAVLLAWVLVRRRS